MPSTLREISARLTDAQWAAVKEAARRADCPLADFVRWSLALACADQGVEFPDDMTRRGQYPRPAEHRSK